jgi:hypothetical protein
MPHDPTKNSPSLVQPGILIKAPELNQLQSGFFPESILLLTAANASTGDILLISRNPQVFPRNWR